MKKLAVVALSFVLVGCSANISESRGEPHRGQVTNSQFSVESIRVHPGKGSYSVKPGGSSKKGERIRKLCIPKGYTGSLIRQSDENPAGFPPERLSGGGCTDVNEDDVIAVTVKK